MRSIQELTGWTGQLERDLTTGSKARSLVVSVNSSLAQCSLQKLNELYH